MASRDLTHTFSKVRADAKSKSVRRRDIAGQAEGKALMREAEIRDWEAAKHALPPVWVDSVDQINEVIRKIKDKIDQLSKYHTKRLMVRFDGSESQDEREIEILTADITDLFRGSEKVLKKMADVKHTTSQSDAKIRQNIQRALATQLQNLSSEFRKSQKDYLSRVKKQKQGPAEFDFLSQTTSSGNKAVDPGFAQSQLMEVEIAEDLINERDEEIKQIAKSIEELATIFKELAVLVIDQGTILDRIDYNMEQVVERTERGIEELKEAEKHQKSGRPMKCVAILLSLIAVMTGILVLKHIH